MVLSVYVLTCALFLFGSLQVSAQAIGEPIGNENKESIGTSVGSSSVAPAPASFIRPVVVAPPKSSGPWWQTGALPGVNWSGLITESLLFSSVQHSFRLATEPGTREGMKGPFLSGWANAVGNLHGWSDGDPFYVNYVGHPMQGSVAGFIWAQNDGRYVGVQFGANPDYWRSRLRATAFSYAYSTLFEIGPLSEASVGKVQSKWPQQGMVDHVITPTIGLGWMVAEDAIDQLIIKRFEERFRNPVLRVFVRGTLNPARSWANIMRLKVPWDRDSRPGAFSPLLSSYLAEQRGARYQPALPEHKELQGEFGVATFELSSYFRPVYFKGSGTAPCLGGGADAAFRMTDTVQWVIDVSGCNLLGLQKDWSGDTLTYLTGPRWTPRSDSRWSPYAHVLLGGMKITKERLDPDLRESLNQAATEHGLTEPVLNPSFTSTSESNAFAVSAGGGVDWRFNPAFALRIANLEYRHSWNPVMNGQTYNNGLSFSVAMVLRLGTW